MTEIEWLECVRILEAAYTHTFNKLSDDDLVLWGQLLADLPGDRVLVACIHMARTTEAFPSVAEIRKHAQGDEQSDWSAAWGEFVTAVSSVGRTSLPAWTDPTIADVVRALGGWLHICETMLTEAEPTWRAQFRDAYRAAQAKARRRETFALVEQIKASKALASGSMALGPGGAA